MMVTNSSCATAEKHVMSDSANFAEEDYRQTRIRHWDAVARQMEKKKGFGGYYHFRLIQIYQFLVGQGQKVIEIGCGQGDLLAALKPKRGVGVDFSGEMIKRAIQRHPETQFIQMDAHDLEFNETFDVIILSDVLNDLWDVQKVFERIRGLAKPNTRIIINSYSRLWEQPLAVVEWLGLGKPTLYQNWLTVDDIMNLLDLTDFETIRQWQEVLCPLNIPVVSKLTNHYLVKLWPFKALALTNFIVARLQAKCMEGHQTPLVSVVVPARNEAGNIKEICARIPEMGRGTEIIFVEGHSTDDTVRVVRQAMDSSPERHCILLQQNGIGKGDAVRSGFAHAKGEILMILDADLTVPPENLRRFYEAIISGKGEFINGVRMVYPMEEEAMRFINLWGNKFFSITFSWLLGQPVKDTLCGTKVLWKRDYDLISSNRKVFGDFDPFGDFDLLFGAIKLNLKIVEMPIRYRSRTYGTTNISRWKHGWLLLRMVCFAARRIKFV